MSQPTPQQKMSKPNPSPPAAPEPPHTPPAHSKLPMIATVVAGFLSSIVSIVALTNAFTKPSTPATTPPATSLALPAQASVQQAQAAAAPQVAATPEHAAPRERLKDFWATLTPEEREKIKHMTPAERKAFKAQREALANAAAPETTGK